MTRLTAALLVSAASVFLAPGLAQAACDPATLPDLICDGASGALPPSLISNARSVTLRNGQTGGALRVRPSGLLPLSVTLDATSALTANDTAPALWIENTNLANTAALSLLLDGNLTAVREALLVQGLNNPVTIRQGAGSTLVSTGASRDVAVVSVKVSSGALIDARFDGAVLARPASGLPGGPAIRLNNAALDDVGASLLPPGTFGADLTLVLGGPVTGGHQDARGILNAVEAVTSGIARVSLNGAVTMRGNGYGLFVSAGRQAHVTLGGGSVSSDGGGLYIRQFVGDRRVNVLGTPNASRRDVGGSVVIEGAGTIVAAGQPDVNGLRSSGIYVETDRDVRVLTTGSITSGGDGLSIVTEFSGSVRVAGTGPIVSSHGDGINIVAGFAAGQKSTVTVEPAATITAGRNGISVGAATVAVTTRGLIRAGATGISAQSGAGSSTITTNAAIESGVNTNGFASGIFASSVADGAITVSVNGDITATRGDGINVIRFEPEAGGTSGTGTISVSLAAGRTIHVLAPPSGSGEESTGYGIITSNFEATGLSRITNNGTVQSLGWGIVSDAPRGAIEILNTGTVSAPQAVVSGDPSLGFGTISRASGLAFTLTNDGTINGAVSVIGKSIAGSVFTNSGVWNAAGRSSTFSGSLANTGMINLRNGVAGDTTITIAGNYSGGGQLMLDASTASGQADRLAITGNVTGTTAVAVNRLAQGRIEGGFLPLITVGGSVAPSAFTSASFADAGPFRETFGVNPAGGGQFGIIQQFNPLLAGLGGLHIAAATAGAALDESATPYVRARPDATGRSVGVWLRGSGGWIAQQLATTITDPSGRPVADALSRLKLFYRTTQGGVDLGWANVGGSGWTVHAGLTGGIATGEARQPATFIDLETRFWGVYGGLIRRGLQIDAMVRREERTFAIINRVLFGSDAPTRVDGSATTGSVAASWRIGLGDTGFALTPRAALSWNDARIETLVIDRFTALEPGADSNSVVRFGGRLSWTGQLGSTAVIEPWLGVERVSNKGRAEVTTIASGGSSGTVVPFAMRSEGYGSDTQLSVGVQLRHPGGRFAGWLEARLSQGKGVQGDALLIGARLAF
jgi:outer membrane autotransporter protein